MYHGEEAIEMGWVVGPIPVEDGVGKKIIAFYCTDIASEETLVRAALCRRFRRSAVGHYF